MGALPLGALVSLPVGSLLSKINTVAAVCGIAIVFVAAEVLVVAVVLRRTPRITVDRGKMTIGHLIGHGGQTVPVDSISSVELVRGSMALMALTEGFAGEGRAVVHLVHGSTIDLGWDAFAGHASRLAWLLGVTLIDPAADASRLKDVPSQIQDPVRLKRQRILVSAAVIGGSLVVLALLFGPLLKSLLK
jgi:hypothetical protein